MTTDNLEGVGPKYSLESMLETRRKTRRAVNDIAAKVVPGVTEREARAMARDTLSELGLRRGWHPVFVRLGENTARNFHDKSIQDVPLREDDIFLVDIGPVDGEMEGDAGDTFVTGDDPEKRRAVQDVHEIWNLVRENWFAARPTGRDLYEYATSVAGDRGWRLNPDLLGHRLSDFPHKAHYGGLLSDVEQVPSPDLWVLEIALVHQDLPIGAFYEDLLLEDQSF